MILSLIWVLGEKVWYGWTVMLWDVSGRLVLSRLSLCRDVGWKKVRMRFLFLTWKVPSKLLSKAWRNPSWMCFVKKHRKLIAKRERNWNWQARRLHTKVHLLRATAGRKYVLLLRWKDVIFVSKLFHHRQMTILLLLQNLMFWVRTVNRYPENIGRFVMPIVRKHAAVTVQPIRFSIYRNLLSGWQ